MMTMPARTLGRRRRLFAAALGALVSLTASLVLAAPGFVGAASAAACSTATGAASCTVTARVTGTAGTLTLESSPNLYWNVVGTGYDQWGSGSSTALGGCAASG